MIDPFVVYLIFAKISCASKVNGKGTFDPAQQNWFPYFVKASFKESAELQKQKTNRPPPCQESILR